MNFKNTNVFKLGKINTLSFILVFAITIVLTFVFTAADASASTVGTSTVYHTEAEIVQYMEMNPTSYDKKNPYAMSGTVEEDKAQALAVLKTARYIAGLNDDVSIYDLYATRAQQAIDKCVENGTISHDFGSYTDQCLLALLNRPNTSLKWSLINGWLEDGGDNNKGKLGHRRAILCPGLYTTGFGYATSGKYTYTSMMDAGVSEEYDDVYGVMWPARTMPINYFTASSDWSYMLCTDVANGTTNPEQYVEVLMKNNATEQQWYFSSANQTDGYFNVNNGGFLTEGLICWDPNGITEYKAGDSYHITIRYIVTGEVIADYDVNFFDSEQYLAPEKFQFSCLTLSEDSGYPYLGWTKSDGATCYQVYRQPAGATEWTLVADDIKPFYYGHIDDTAKPGIKYNYMVIAVNEADGVKYERMADSPNSVRTISMPLKKPTISSIKAISKKANKITWKKITGATGYKVYRRVSGKSTWTLVKTITCGSTVSYIDTSAKSGVKYQYRVKAHRKNRGIYVYSSYSGYKSVKTK